MPIANGLRSTSVGFAQDRLNRLLGRLFSVALALSGTEVFINVYHQLPELDPFFGPLAALISLLSHLIFILTAWIGNRPEIGQQIHAVVSLVILVTWPIQVSNPESLPLSFQPWIWWVLGPAAIAAGLSMGRLWGSAVLVAMPVIWYFVHSSADGGSATSLRSIQDSLYTFLFSISFTLVLLLLRDQAAKADLAGEQLIQSEANKAAADASERERLRIGALIHDRVLTALIVAGKAKAPAEVNSSRELAKQAISALNAASEIGAQPDTAETSVGSLFKEIRRQFSTSNIEIDEAETSLKALPTNVAQAYLEATRQAVANSLQHAGPTANRIIILRGASSGFKIVVKDDGVGFRPSRVPKSRLGIRVSILERIESVGGKAYIDSRPGGGCSIILSWASQ